MSSGIGPYGGAADSMSKYEKELMMQLYVLQAMEQQFQETSVLNQTLGPGGAVARGQGPWWQGMPGYGGSSDDKEKKSYSERRTASQRRKMERKMMSAWTDLLKDAQRGAPKQKRQPRSPMEIAQREQQRKVAEAMMGMPVQTHVNERVLGASSNTPWGGQTRQTAPYIAPTPMGSNYPLHRATDSNAAMYLQPNFPTTPAYRSAMRTE